MAGGWREREEGERAEGGQSSEICSGMKELHSTEKALNSMLYVKTSAPLIFPKSINMLVTPCTFGF